MADIKRALRNEPEVPESEELDGFGPRDVTLTRNEVRIKRSIDRIQERCGDLEDNDAAVQCFSLTQEMDREFDNVIRESRGERRVQPGKSSEKIDII